MRELSKVDVQRVSGGSPHIVGGAVIGGVIGGVGYYAGTSNPTAGGMATAVGTGALSGAFGGGALLWGGKALKATFPTARIRLGTRAAKFGGGFGLSSFGGGMAMMGFSSPSPHARMCSGQAGGSD